jgi:alpha-N-arabinofuranosidase
VNVIAPILTEPGGKSWRQTTFFPFSITAELARGRTLQLMLDSPTHVTALHGEVPLVDAVATHDAETGRTAVFLVNRSLEEAITVEIDTKHLSHVSIDSIQTIHDDDIHACNTHEDPSRVAPRGNESAKLTGDILSITLPPVSWTALALSDGASHGSGA